MKYHALFVIFEKRQNFRSSSAANYRWRFKAKYKADAHYLYDSVHLLYAKP